MASVPTWFIKDKDVDYDAEIFSCMNVPRLFGTRIVQPPPLGVFSLLEVTDSKFYKDFENCSSVDFARAFHIACRGREVAADVQEWLEAGGRENFKEENFTTWHRFDYDSVRFLNESSLAPEEFIRFRAWFNEPAMNGYEMIPPGGRGGLYVFGAETIGTILRIMAGSGLTPQQILWDVPLCLVGFKMASEARFNGVKGVARPKDPEDIRAKIAEAEERERVGELHPWQIDEPHVYPLQPDQLQNHPEVKDKHNRALKAYLRRERERKTAQNHNLEVAA